MSIRLRKITMFSFIMILVFFLINIYQVDGNETEALSRFSQAEESLKNAFVSIIEGERAGADISELVQNLNTALDYYSEAKKAIRLGKYENSVLLSEKSIEISNNILEIDINLMILTRNVGATRFRNQLFISFTFVCFTILFSFLSWRFFKVYYSRRILGLKPELVADES